MRAEANPICFQPVGQEDLKLLDQWLHEPHIRKWWGDPEKELELIRDMVEGRDSTRPFLILLEDEPVGYIQCWRVDDYQNEAWLEDNPWLGNLPAGTVGVDLSIGDPDRLSQGIGSRALKAFVEKLIEEGRRSIIIDPDPANERAVRAYRKAGFRPIPHLVGHSGDSLIMQYESNMQETMK